MNLLVTGASGLLGAYLLREARSGGDEVTAWSGAGSGDRFGVPLRSVDLADADALIAAFREAPPDAVIHAGAISSAEQCRRDPDAARRVNTDATARLAALAANAGARLVFVSTDLVFDGEHAPYDESAQPAPLSVYARTKADAERAVLAAGGVVARVSLLFGPSLTDRPGFFDQQLSALAAERPITLFEDEWRTPLGFLTAAQGLLALARSEHTGVFHLGGPERMSRLEMGRRLAAYLGYVGAEIVPASREHASGEPRPRDVSLASERWRALFPALAWPRFEEALEEMGMLGRGEPPGLSRRG
jgi:dTDP-4-dehydrorhamnose reductase